MGELTIEGNHAEQVAQMKIAIKTMWNALYGNGQQGIVDFIISTRAQFRLLLILLTLIFAAITAMAALEANRQWNHGLIHTPKITAPKTAGENTLAKGTSQPQHAGINRTSW